MKKIKNKYTFEEICIATQILIDGDINIAAETSHGMYDIKSPSKAAEHALYQAGAYEPRESDNPLTFYEICSAAEILLECEFDLYVSDNYGYQGIGKPWEAAEYILNREAAMVRFENHFIEQNLLKMRKTAQEKGVYWDAYFYYIKYSDPWTYARIVGDDIPPGGVWGQECAMQTKKGHLCKHRVHFQGDFEKFQPGVSDMCTRHKPKRRKKSSKKLSGKFQ